MKTQLTGKQRKLVEQNLDLARSVAHKFAKVSPIEYEELEAIAFLGLTKAIAVYDESRGAISSIAVPYIKGEILHYLRDKANTIKTPRNQEKLAMRSLDAPISENMTLLEMIADDETIESIPTLTQSDIEAKLKKFPRRTREILELRLQGLNPKDIAEKLGISANSVYVTISNAKKEKRNRFRCRYDREDYTDKDLSILTKLERQTFELYLAGLENRAIAKKLGKKYATITATIARSRQILDNPTIKKRVGRPEKRSLPKFTPVEIDRPVISNCAIASRIDCGWTIEEVAFSFGITSNEAKLRLKLIGATQH